MVGGATKDTVNGPSAQSWDITSAHWDDGYLIVRDVEGVERSIRVEAGGIAIE